MFLIAILGILSGSERADHITRVFKQKVHATYEITTRYDEALDGKMSIFMPVPPDTDQQKLKGITMRCLQIPELNAIATVDVSPLHRKLLELTFPVRGRLPASGLRVKVDIDLDMYESKLEAGVAAHGKAQISASYLDSTREIDYENPTFQDWMRNNNLHRLGTESVVEYAHRVFLYLVQRSTYTTGGSYESRRPSEFCVGLKGDCGGMSLAFCAAMRLSGIPSRPFFGRWALDATEDYGQTHVVSEFWDDGLGWVPVDVASAVVHFAKTPDRVFGKADGKFIAFHENTDIEPFKGFWQGWAQYALVSYTGSGKFDPKVDEAWTVRRIK